MLIVHYQEHDRHQIGSNDKRKQQFHNCCRRYQFQEERAKSKQMINIHAIPMRCALHGLISDRRQLNFLITICSPQGAKNKD